VADVQDVARIGTGSMPGDATEKARAKGGDYRRAIDLLRFLAALGIVLDHTLAWSFVGYPALGLFLILTSYFGIGSYRRSVEKGEGAGSFWISRAKRILIPWLFWCAVYRITYEVISDQPFHILSDPFTLLIGPSIHLWFLPFAAVALIVIPTIARDVVSRQNLIWASVLLVPFSIALGLIHAKSGIEGWQIAGSPIPQPVPQWAYSLPIYIWGALAAVAHRLGLPQITLAAAAVSSAILLALDWDIASIQLLLCAVVFEICYRLPWKGEWMTKLAAYAFGIYLMHPFFLLVAYKLFGADVDKTLSFAVAFFGSWAGTWVFKRLPVLKGMV
jgi:peptidoglycan/LPS O-acetylase OafA/YrhL